MRISDWSSDVCSSDLARDGSIQIFRQNGVVGGLDDRGQALRDLVPCAAPLIRQAGHRARWRVAFTKVTHPLFHSLEEVVSKAFAAEISRGLALPPSKAAPATPLERGVARGARVGIFDPTRSPNGGEHE